ncbi:hypothetical protein [Caldimonas brevitalea]|uniref:Uncharacterized protein n=1 Tax=Caldimonas brevitalea TaxID=413882 RepID=A0A0G3BGK6_9BURK|nr:hypothetical protein [Caldimonas brevitalea]AKJ28569.1 hypothetical protein AAW51_1878 [Caldimonas brevitalea]
MSTMVEVAVVGATHHRLSQKRMQSCGASSLVVRDVAGLGGLPKGRRYRGECMSITATA